MPHSLNRERITMKDDDLIITLVIGMLAAVPACLASAGMRKWFQERRPAKMDPDPVKRAGIEQAPERWPDILKWVAAGEELQVTHHDKVVARLVPADVAQRDRQQNNVS
jgi:hypothetical protein